MSGRGSQRVGWTFVRRILITAVLTVAGVATTTDAQLHYSSRRGYSRYDRGNYHRYYYNSYDNGPSRRVGGGLNQRQISDPMNRRMGLKQGQPTQSRRLGYSDNRRASRYSSSRRWSR